jgi:hypothetical protein
MATFTKFQGFVEALAEKKHNLGADTLRYYLTNTAPDAAADFVKADLPTEISAGNGYTAGGPSITISSSAQTSGTYKLVIADVTITAAGGSIGPFRYIVLYNDTASNDELIGYFDYGSSITLQDTETFTLDADATNGILTIA